MILGSMVLAGGRSDRMGRSKPALPWGDGSLLLHTVQTLIECSHPVVVVARDDHQDLPPLHTECELIYDARPGEGPLQAIDAGLAFLERKCDAVFVAGCDLPFLDAVVIGRFFDLLGEQMGVVPTHDGEPQPLCAIYNLRVHSAVHELVQAGQRRAQALAELPGIKLLGPAELRAIDPALRFFRDVDTPDDYEAARKTAGLT
ncbi:MAG: molybdenum cofactor guanylyltransferase [Planctomycetes bacterium]|nr:molybdenum cofactor guanylyltransferase [Planctomycetota bacterium]